MYKVKVLTRQTNELKEKKVDTKILTSDYIKQLNQKISYNTMEKENRRDFGKKELVLKKIN